MINKAKKILKDNSHETFTVPNKDLYPFQWNWDSLLCALGISTYNLNRAILEIETLYDSQWTNGMLPHIIFHKNNNNYFPGPSEWSSNTRIPTSCITQPPIGGTILWTIYNNNKKKMDFRRLKKLFYKTYNNLKWFEEYRDIDNQGLISIIHPWESGRDNSIEWDEPLNNISVSLLKKYSRKDLKQICDEERPSNDDYDKYITLLLFGENCYWDKNEMFFNSPFNVIDVGIQFMYIKSLKDMLKLSYLFDDNYVTKDLNNMIIKYSKGVDLLWNRKLNCYTSYDYKEKKHIDEITHASFLCYYAGIFNKNYDQYIIRNYYNYIDNVKYLVPSCSINNNKFNNKKYWKGPIWAIINLFLLIGFNKIDEKIYKSIFINTKNLIEDNDFYEYFDPITGKGCGGKDFSWTASVYLILKSKYNLLD